MVEQQKPSQKMRMDLANTLRPGLDVLGRRVYELKGPLGASVSSEHNS